MRRTFASPWFGASSSSSLSLSSAAAAPPNIKARSSTQIMASAFASFTGIVVLILDLPSGSRLQAHQRGPDVVCFHFEDHGLLLSFIVGVAYGEKVLVLLSEHKERRKDQRAQKIPLDVLPIFQQVDLLIGNAPVRLARRKDEIFSIHRLYTAMAPGGYPRNRSADVLGVPAVVARLQSEHQTEKHERPSRCHIHLVADSARNSHTEFECANQTGWAGKASGHHVAGPCTANLQRPNWHAQTALSTIRASVNMVFAMACPSAWAGLE